MEKRYEEEVTSKVTVPGYPTDAAKQPTFKVTDPSTLPDGKQEKQKEKQMFQLR
ncbi:hypothetical protein [Staphylococcus aureus]|uniref:hypothetical protein n=1 Tax=Staphylococcus aureus TaxID=1280 RepID=UPI001EFF2BD8|nr:hypothetical protein [Staphylococcus aureus]ULW15529.1 hypothetical protein IF722_13650 [Staphylococcus aureus]